MKTNWYKSTVAKVIYVVIAVYILIGFGVHVGHRHLVTLSNSSAYNGGDEPMAVVDGGWWLDVFWWPDTTEIGRDSSGQEGSVQSKIKGYSFPPCSDGYNNGYCDPAK